MKLIQLLLPAAMLLLSSHAIAGEFNVARVDIDFGEQVAEGNLIAARASNNQYERIGCGVGAGYVLGHYANCEATDATNNHIQCITDEPEMIDTIASINTYSYVYFTWGTVDGKGDPPDGYEWCRHVTFATRSVHIPEKIEIEMELESFD